jgi:hypothetical protein
MDQQAIAQAAVDAINGVQTVQIGAMAIAAILTIAALVLWARSLR